MTEEIISLKFDPDSFKNISGFEDEILECLGKSVKIKITGYWDDFNHPPLCNCGRDGSGILEYWASYLWKCRICGRFWRLW